MHTQAHIKLMLYPYGSWTLYDNRDQKNFENDYEIEEDIIEIKYSCGKSYIAILTQSALYIWKTKVLRNIKFEH